MCWGGGLSGCESPECPFPFCSLPSFLLSFPPLSYLLLFKVKKVMFKKIKTVWKYKLVKSLFPPSFFPDSVYR